MAIPETAVGEGAQADLAELRFYVHKPLAAVFGRLLFGAVVLGLFAWLVVALTSLRQWQEDGWGMILMLGLLLLFGLLSWPIVAFTSRRWVWFAVTADGITESLGYHTWSLRWSDITEIRPTKVVVGGTGRGAYVYGETVGFMVRPGVKVPFWPRQAAKTGNVDAALGNVYHGTYPGEAIRAAQWYWQRAQGGGAAAAAGVVTSAAGGVTSAAGGVTSAAVVDVAAPRAADSASTPLVTSSPLLTSSPGRGAGGRSALRNRGPRRALPPRRFSRRLAAKVPSADVPPATTPGGDRVSLGESSRLSLAERRALAWISRLRLGPTSRPPRRVAWLIALLLVGLTVAALVDQRMDPDLKFFALFVVDAVVVGAWGVALEIFPEWRWPGYSLTLSDEGIVERAWPYKLSLKWSQIEDIKFYPLRFWGTRRRGDRAQTLGFVVASDARLPWQARAIAKPGVDVALTDSYQGAGPELMTLVLELWQAALPPGDPRRLITPAARGAGPAGKDRSRTESDGAAPETRKKQQERDLLVGARNSPPAWLIALSILPVLVWKGPGLASLPLSHLRNHEAVCTIQSVQRVPAGRSSHAVLVSTRECGELLDANGREDAAEPYQAAIGKASKFRIGDYAAKGQKPWIVAFDGPK